MANTWRYYEVHTEKCLLTTLVPCAKYICHLEATGMLRNCIKSQVAHTFLLTKKISLQLLKQNMASILSHGLDFQFYLFIYFFKGWQISLLKSELLEGSNPSAAMVIFLTPYFQQKTLLSKPKQKLALLQ